MDTTRPTLVDISSSDLYNSLLTNIAANNKRFMDRSYDSLSRQQKDSIAKEQGLIKERDYTIVSVPLHNKSTASDNNALTLYLRQTLSKILDSNTVNTVLSKENMQQYWIPAFTHRSYDPTPDRNYEKLEYWGDSALKLSFRNYLALNYPQFNESELSNLSNHYMSTEEQASLSDQLGLPKYLRSYVAVTRGIQEDLLESFYGALYSIGGMDLVDSVTTYLYTSVYVDPQYSLGSFTTRVQQALQGLGLPRPSEGFVSNRENVTAHLYYDNESVVRTLNRRFRIPYRRTVVRRTGDEEIMGYSIATSTGRYRGNVNTNAYQNLSRLFDQRGVYDAVQARRTEGIEELLKYVQDNIDPRYESVSVYRQTGDYEVTAVLQGTIGPIVETIYAATISYDYGRAPREREIYSLLLDSMRSTAPTSKRTRLGTEEGTVTRRQGTVSRRGRGTTRGGSTVTRGGSTVSRGGRGGGRQRTSTRSQTVTQDVEGEQSTSTRPRTSTRGRGSTRSQTVVEPELVTEEQEEVQDETLTTIPTTEEQSVPTTTQSISSRTSGRFRSTRPTTRDRSTIQSTGERSQTTSRTSGRFRSRR